MLTEIALFKTLCAEAAVVINSSVRMIMIARI
jgi:hypothetical protein